MEQLMFWIILVRQAQEQKFVGRNFTKEIMKITSNVITATLFTPFPTFGY